MKSRSNVSGRKPTSKKKSSKPKAEIVKPTIANLPFDISSGIANWTLDWEKDPAEMLGLFERNINQTKQPEKKVRSYTFRSLTLLSKQSYETWIVFLLATVRLENKHLPGLLGLIERAPSALKHLRHLTFLDFPFKHGLGTVPRGIQKELDDQFAMMDRLQPGTVAADQREFVMTMLATKIITIETSKRLLSLHPLFKPRSWSQVLAQAEASASLGEWYTSSKLIAMARGLILNASPNLESISTLGETSFPFARRVGVKDAMPLKGLESLRSLEIRTGLLINHDHHISAANLLWCLSLPNLKQAALECFWKSEDFFFLLNHSEGWKSGNYRSNVKELSLEMFMVEAREDAQELSMYTIHQATRDLLCYTSHLTRLSMTVSLGEGYDGMQSTVFSGLKESFQTLSTLELRGFHVSQNPASINILSEFTNLSTLVTEAFLGYEVESLLTNPSFKLNNEQLFGRSPLETVYLMGNFRWQGPLAPNFCPEHFISFLMGNLKTPNRLSSLKKIVTFKEAVNYSNAKVEVAEEKKVDAAWKRARMELERACDRNSVHLVLLSAISK